MAIDPFANKNKGNNAQNVEKIEVNNDLVHKAIELYGKFLYTKPDQTFWPNEPFFSEKYVQLPLLKPAEIDLTHSVLAQDPFKLKERNAYLLASYTSRLIMFSYISGTNEFFLTIRNPDTERLGGFLTADKDRRLQLTIYGDVGKYTGLGSSYLDLYVQGSSELGTGNKIMNSSVRQRAYAGDDFGSYSKNSVFYAHAGVGNSYATEANGSQFHFNEKVGNLTDMRDALPKNCSFIVYNEDTMKQIKKDLGFKGSWIKWNAVRVEK